MANTPPHTDAKAIAEYLLDITGHALMSGDFAAFAEVFDLPQVMTVAGDAIEVETRADLERMFDTMHQHFKGIGVTDLIRLCEAAEFVGPGEINATHVTHLMSRGTRVQDPYPVIATLVHRKSGWKVSSAEYDLDPSGGQARAIKRARSDQPRDSETDTS